jgi:hypothetical protein
MPKKNQTTQPKPKREASLAAPTGSDALRVTLEVTENEWMWRLHQPGKPPKAFGMARSEYGATGKQKGDTYDHFPEELAEAIGDADPMAIMRWLKEEAEALAETA